MAFRIVHATPFFEPAWKFGGPAAQLSAVSRRMAERGHDVRILTSDLGIGPDLPRDTWVRRNGYRVYYASAGPFGACPPYFLPGIKRALSGLLENVDVFHNCLSFTHTNVLVRRFCRKARIPYIYTPRACLDPVRLRMRSLSKQLFLSLFERRVIRDASLVHVLTDVERQDVLSQGADPERIRVIPNGVDVPTASMLPPRDEFRRSHGYDDQAPLILFLGQLLPVKGLDLLIDAVASIVSRCPEARVVVAGPADTQGAADLDRRARERGVRDRFNMVGTLTGRSKSAAFRAADLFVLPSRSEGMPNAVLEACAHGTPVVITQACNLPEVAEYRAGQIIAQDADVLATAMTQILENKEDRQRMGQNGRRMVAECFSFDQVMDLLERLYGEAIRRSHQSVPGHSESWNNVRANGDSDRLLMGHSIAKAGD